ncbi:DNA translocase FtsK [Candidatus Dependentiae bacterium]|nr:DNA translocase FtsK [Candidatus Dependentiae bacterium]
MNHKYIEYIKHYIHRYAFSAALLLFAFFLIGSFLKFSIHDQSVFYHSYQGSCNNLFGYVGASIAALIVYFLGSAAYFFAGFIGYLALLLISKNNFNEHYDRILGAFLFTIAIAMLSNLYQAGFHEFSSYGGIIGTAFVSLLSYFDKKAQFFIVYYLLFIATILLLRFSHLYVTKYLLKITNIIYHYTIQVDHFPARCIRTAATGIAYFYYSLQHLIRTSYSLLNGTMIKESQSSIVEFETDKKIDQNVQNLDLFFTKKEPLKELKENIPTTEQHQKNQEEHVSTMLAQKYQETSKQQTYELPNIDEMLAQGNQPQKYKQIEKTVLDEQAAILEEKLSQFGIKGQVTRVYPGPVITMFEYKPESHIKLSKILALEDDLAMALQALNIRILAPIPGKAVVGFEVANKVRKSVLLSNIFHSSSWINFDGHLPLILGENTHGDHIVVDLATMPHLLIAGSTGSGKSVAMNCMLVSILCARNPEQVRCIIIDPKQIEFSAYEDIAHLLFPIITDCKKAIPVLKWLVSTMEERYEMMAEQGVKNIFEYQKLAKEQPELEPMPFIVLIIDELADLMMTIGKDIEDLIARLAQMSRAAGIHMIVATQRPSVDVITGLIKVNFPNRISFKVTSKIDSRTILDDIGAERLLGKGDMLFLDAKDPDIKRIHGAYISNKEIQFLVNHIKSQKEVSYLDIVELLAHNQQNDALFETDQTLYKEIVAVVKNCDEISISMIQRRFRIGYNRSARIIEALQADGIILPSDGSKMRRVIK